MPKSGNRAMRTRPRQCRRRVAPLEDDPGDQKKAKTYPAMLSARITFFQMPGIAATNAIVSGMVEGAPSDRYNTAFPARRGTEVAVTGSTRNRLGGASRHVGSNPTPSAILAYSFGSGGIRTRARAERLARTSPTYWRAAAGEPAKGRRRRRRSLGGRIPLPPLACLLLTWVGSLRCLAWLLAACLALALVCTLWLLKSRPGSRRISLFATRDRPAGGTPRVRRRPGPPQRKSANPVRSGRKQRQPHISVCRRFTWPPADPRARESVEPAEAPQEGGAVR